MTELRTLPGPGRSPLQLLRLLFDPYRFYEENRSRYGERFRIRLPPGMNSLCTARADDVAAILSADENLFERKTSSLVDLLGADTILTLDGRRHTERRKLVGPCLSGRQLQNLATSMWKAADLRLGQWEAGQRRTMFREMSEVTMDVMCAAVFGFPPGDDRFDTFKTNIRSTMQAVSPALLASKLLRNDLGAWSPWGRYVRARRRTDEVIAAEVARHRAPAGKGAQHDEPGPSSMLGILSHLRAASDDGGEALDPQTIAGELYGFLLVSYENVANHLAWAVYLLLEHPEVLARLRTEIDDVLASTDPGEQAMALARLPYLDAVLKEVLRILPPSETFRRLAAPFQLDGLQLEEGDLVIPSIYMVHRDPKRYPEPDRFWPERWQLGAVGEDAFDYLTFGGGARRCVAQSFAMMELKMVLAATISAAELTLVPGQSFAARRRRLATLAKDGVRVEVERMVSRPAARPMRSVMARAA